jgi:hypothetical protein
MTSAAFRPVHTLAGAGIRLSARRLALFEAVINMVHTAAPAAAIAFNTRPQDSADARRPADCCVGSSFLQA